MSTGTRFEALFKHRVAAAVRRQRAVVLARTLAVSGAAVVIVALALRVWGDGGVCRFIIPGRFGSDPGRRSCHSLQRNDRRRGERIWRPARRS